MSSDRPGPDAGVGLFLLCAYKKSSQRQDAGLLGCLAGRLPEGEAERLVYEVAMDLFH